MRRDPVPFAVAELRRQGWLVRNGRLPIDGSRDRRWHFYTYRSGARHILVALTPAAGAAMRAALDAINSNEEQRGAKVIPLRLADERVEQGACRED